EESHFGTGGGRFKMKKAQGEFPWAFDLTRFLFAYRLSYLIPGSGGGGGGGGVLVVVSGGGGGGGGTTLGVGFFFGVFGGCIFSTGWVEGEVGWVADPAGAVSLSRA